MDKEKIGKQILDDMILEEYETIIFDYLINNCIDLKDENIKEIVNLKCKQFDDLVKNINKLKKQQKELITNNKRLSKVAEKRYDKILELEQELQKYKSLYENEKNHTDTLIRIIKKIEKYMEEHSCEVSYLDCKFYETTQYKEILDLLKEIK